MFAWKQLTEVFPIYFCQYFFWTYFRPVYPTDELEEEEITEDDTELTLNKLEEDVAVCLTICFILY